MGDEKKLTSRMLNFSISDRKFEESDGGLIVNGVKILAAGTWTDSFQKTPCRYPPKLLQEFAANWQANGFWLRHTGGAPRSINDKIGEVRNPRFENDAVVGDVFLHLATSGSRDYAEMAKRGLVDAVSAELGTTDIYDPKSKTYEATYLEFTGLAAVDKGACKVCGLRGHEQEKCPELESMTEKEAEKPVAEKIVEAEKPIVAVAPVVKPEEMKALSDALDVLRKELEAFKDASKKELEASKLVYEERIKKLENAPNPKTLAESKETSKELEDAVKTAHMPRISKQGRSIVVD